MRRRTAPSACGAARTLVHRGLIAQEQASAPPIWTQQHQGSRSRTEAAIRTAMQPIKGNLLVTLMVRETADPRASFDHHGSIHVTSASRSFGRRPGLRLILSCPRRRAKRNLERGPAQRGRGDAKVRRQTPGTGISGLPPLSRLRRSAVGDDRLLPTGLTSFRPSA